MSRLTKSIVVISMLVYSAWEGHLQADCWIYRYSGTTNALQGVFFTGRDTGTAVGVNGTILRTTDGGKTWVSQESGTSATLLGVYFTDVSNGTAVGWSGTILRTTDGGGKWTAQTSKVNQPLYGVWFTGVSSGVVVGGAGTILQTSDGGATWIARTSGIPDYLNSVSFGGHDTGFAVGGSGTILRTTNGGLSWASQTSGTAVTLCGVWCVDGSRATAVGFSGTLLQTSDGGINWAPRNSKTVSLLRSVFFADLNSGLAVGSGVIISTSDGGTGWNILHVPDLSLGGVSSATAVGSAGTIISQIDNCSSPTPVTLASPPNGATGQLFLVNFAWNYLPFVQIVNYRIQVATDSTFSAGIVSDTAVPQDRFSTAMSALVGGLKASTVYYWRVEGVFADEGVSPWSDAWKFTSSRGSVITGKIFDDLNRDSVRSAEEPYLDSCRIDISGKILDSSYTDINGKFYMTGLDSGTYTITEQINFGWKCSAFCSQTVYVGVNDSVSLKDIGNTYPWNNISGCIFNDINENGRFDSSDKGLAGWPVRLSSSLSADDSVLTDSGGTYIFRRVDLGENTVKITATPPWEQIFPTLGEGYSFEIYRFNQRFTGADFSIHTIPSRVKIAITVKDSTPLALRDIWFGIRPGATYGIWGVDSFCTTADFSEGEFDLPPTLPGLFDARFKDPNSTLLRFGNGSWTDMRAYNSAAQIDTFLISFSPGRLFGGDYPMRLVWSKELVRKSFSGPVYLRDVYGTLCDMKVSDSILITNPLVSSLLLVSQGPVLPVAGAALDLKPLPREFILEQNYPNPFNQSTVIGYQLPSASRVRLKIYDLLGRLQQTLVDGVQDAGFRSVVWDAGGSGSGIYFCVMESASAGKPDRWSVQVKKIILIK